MSRPTSLADVTRRALELESRQNELRVAIVRVVFNTLVTAMGVGLWLRGQRTGWDLLTYAAITAIAVGIYFAVRRLYRTWFRFAIPPVDMVAISYLLLRRAAAEGVTPAVAATTAATAALFAASGGLRFDCLAAAWTTLLACVVALSVVGTKLGPGMPFMLAGLLGVGFLTVWQSDVIRRVVLSEQGRALLRRLLPPTVVDTAYTDPEAMSAAPRRAEVTVLVTDLRGFTAIAEQLGPEKVVELLNEFHEALADIVVVHRGTVDKFMGDGMLAVFGAPEELPRHAAHGVRAALKIREAVADLNRRHPDRPPLRIGMGLHSGPVVSGIIGGGTKAEFTVIGDTVNIASRLEAMTKDLAVDLLVSAVTAQQSEAGPYVDRGELPVRGRSQPIAVSTPADGFELPSVELRLPEEISFVGRRPAR